MFCIKSKEHFYYTAKIVFFCLSAISLIVILTGNSRCYSRFNPGFLPYQTKWKIPAYLPVKKYRPRSSERKHARKGTACRIIPNICLITTL